MSLLEVRREFIKQSGRVDLVVNTTNHTDNGADFFIKAGQRFLDLRLGYPQEEAELTFALATSAITTTLANVRAILSVAVRDSGDNTINYLKRKSIRELREEYGDEHASLGAVDTGEPRSWALGWLRDGVVDDAGELGQVVLFTMPPADKQYTIVTRAKLLAGDLSSNSAVSFWTEEHPDVLVQAALYKLEGSYRNNEGSRATLRMIDDALLGIYHDKIEQMQVDQTHLKDSHRFISDVRRSPRSGIVENT